MSLIRPFAALRPPAERAREVAAPPYDVLNSAEARERAAGRPWSFLHISKPEIDLPVGTDPFAAEVYAQARRNLDRMIDEGVLIRDATARYYLYRLQTADSTQLGLVAAVSVKAYLDGDVLKHEFTRPDKEDDRVRQIDVLNAQTGPVLLGCRGAATLQGIGARVVTSEPIADVAVDDGVRHTIWGVDQAADIAQLTEAFSVQGESPRLYIADGHHRSAAAARVAEKRGLGMNASHEYFLGVIFPADQMRILDYNRVVRDLNGMSTTQFLERLAERFEVRVSQSPVRPTRAHQFGLYVAGCWHELTLIEHYVPHDDPVGRLDVSLLTSQILAPVLGIEDLRRDPRIDFVGGIRGLPELVRRVDSGEMAAAFALHPTSMTDLMAVADSGEVMPPKSTWFEPKLADGLLSHVLD